MTFDGRHPCALCKVVQAGKTSERQKPSSMSDTKLDLICRLPGALLIPQPRPKPPAGVDVVGDLRFDPPLVPPPRAA
jgi:hypothetical protein